MRRDITKTIGRIKLNGDLTKTVPNELRDFINQSDNNSKTSPEVLRDSRGRISSVCYYNHKQELTRQVFYNGAAIKLIEYYHKNTLTTREEFEDSKLITKKHYCDGSLESIIKFGYDAMGNIQKISKEENSEITTVEYKYDTLSRIVSCQIYNSKGFVSKQEYNYDVQNRVIYYSDENQKIIINNYSKKNELLNYEITDRMDNVISVINNFSDTGYICTKLQLNEHSLTLSDTSYVDNIMLKKPNATEDDLDLIISKLYYQNDVKNGFYGEPTRAKQNALQLVDNMILQRVLPISIRKRVLYSIASNSKY